MARYLPRRNSKLNPQQNSNFNQNATRNNTSNTAPPTGSVLAEDVYKYLQKNPNFLENYILKEVELDVLEEWIVLLIQMGKTSQSIGAEVVNTAIKSSFTTRWKISFENDKQKILEDLLQTSQDKQNAIFLLFELGECVASAVNADGFNLYLKNNEDQELYYIRRDSSDNKNQFTSQVVKSPNCIATFVAQSKQTIRTTRPDNDSRFSDGVAINKDIAKVIMCQPVLQNAGELTGVLEFYRKEKQPEFTTGDEQIGHRYQVWCGIALYYTEVYHSLMNRTKRNDFLLNIIQSIFHDMGSMDSLIMKIMNYSQKLVKADRASLFLLDSKSREVYARIFDMKNGLQDDSGVPVKEIRFPIGTGFAGLSAETGEVVCVPDAYQDPRFNKAIDDQTGYRTRSLLCMPIFLRGSVIGVMQMVNKETGIFNQDDIEGFRTFGTYCGLALHHAKLYDKIRRSENRFQIILEILAYHNTCSEEDYLQLKALPYSEPIKPNLDDYYFPTGSLDENEKTAQTVYMFQDLFGLSRFNMDSLIRFTLTVKKNYRRVPYHNWNHGFTVANSGYALLKKTQHVFTFTESLALYIGCLCHDLDHRGKTNKFMLDSASPLAAIYTTSTLEHHHFNQTMAILQQEDLNILRSLSSFEYRQVLNDIHHCILATDLALFFGYKAKLQMIQNTRSFDWNNAEHRLLVKAISMTACDLCASTKPWEQQLETAQVIFEEFYDQGDAERAAGREPMPMMDRNKTDFQPAAQVGFLKGICIPCYSLLSAVVPETQQMLDGCKNNLTRWQELADQQSDSSK